MIKHVIESEDYNKKKVQEYLSRFHKARVSVYEFFNNRYDSGDTEITCTVDDVNELLESLGVDVEADSEEDARDIVTNSLELQFTDEGSLDGWDVEVTDASQQ